MPASILVPMVMAMKNRNHSRDFLLGMRLREEKNVKGLVHKSKGFLPMNVSNPKEEFSDVEGTGCIGEERSKVAGLKEKLARGFS